MQQNAVLWIFTFLQINPVYTAAGSYLFFGCRNKDKDYYLDDDWQLKETQSLLSVFTAFSRDQVS